MRARVDLSNYIRKIEFTEAVKRRLIDEMKDAVESVRGVQREIEGVERQLNPKNKKQKLKEEERKNAQRQIKELKLKLKAMTDTLEQEPAELKQTLDTIIGASGRRSKPRRSSSKPTSGWSCRSPRVHEPGAAILGFDSGRNIGLMRRSTSSSTARVQVLDVRDVVDPPGHHPRDRGSGPDDPHPVHMIETI